MPAEGYEHVASRGQRGDRSVGLALDYDNQDGLTGGRIERWTDGLIDECGLAGPSAPAEAPGGADAGGGRGADAGRAGAAGAAGAPARPLADRRMDELLAALPEAAGVLARRGIDPRTRCHAAARGSLPPRRVLGRVCPVDDPAAALAELEVLLAAR